MMGMVRHLPFEQYRQHGLCYYAERFPESPVEIPMNLIFGNCGHFHHLVDIRFSRARLKSRLYSIGNS